MGILLTELVVVFLVFLYLRKCWRYWVKASRYELNPPQRNEKEMTELAVLKGRLVNRHKRAKTLGQFLANPKNKKFLKSLMLQELETAQKMKGSKRRILSNLKYESIKKAAETGKFDDEVMDFLNK